MKRWRWLVMATCMCLGSLAYAQNPEAEWRMDECGWSGTSGEVADSRGNGYDGVAVNGANTTNGMLCNAGQFNGSTQYVSIPNADFGFGNRMSVSAWVRWDIDPSTGQNHANIISNNTASQIDVGQFWLQHDNGNQHFQFAVTTTNSRYVVNSTTSPQQGVWYQVVGVYDRNRIRIYVNGSEEGEVNTNGDVIDYDPSYLLTIGRWAYTGFSRSFSGQIDEVKVYDRRLRDNDVQDLYDNESNGRNYDDSQRTCPVCNPELYHHMDECSWDGTSGEVLDSSGNGYDGTAFNNATTINTGIVCYSGTFNRSTSMDYVVLDNRAIDGADDFTFMTWFRTPDAGTQGIISGASASNANSWLLFQDSDDRFSTYIYNDTERYDLPYSINHDSWHHVAWVREGNREYLYLDGNLVDSNNRTTATIYVDSGGLMVGQEQDCVGGCFDSSQAFIGELDELMIYQSALSSTQIQTIYSNQAAGLEPDGSSRSCSACDPLADWHMDECSWSGTPNEVEDSTVNGYHGMAVGGNITDDTDPLLCRYGDFTGTGYMMLNNTLTLPTTWTFLSWVKFPLDPSDHATVGGYGNVFIFGSVIGAGDLALIYNSGGTNLRWGVYDNGGGISAADFPDFLTGWHHIAIIARSDGSTELLLDGNSQGTVNRRTNGVLQYVGTSSDDPPGQTMGGGMDEVKIFAGELSTSQINQIIANEQAGTNWDGTARTCDSCGPIADYRMDDCIWEGVSGEVVDSSGNGYDGVANDALTVDGGFLCRAGQFNSGGATGEYISLPAAVADGLQDFTFNTWVKPEDTGAHTLVSGAASGAPDAINLYLPWSTLLITYLNDAFQNWYFIPDLANGSWHMVTWTRENNTEYIYVDGNLEASGTVTTVPVTVESLILGQDQDSVGGGFDDSQALRGLQDEVTFWNTALSSAEIGGLYNNLTTGNNWDGTTRNCNSCIVVSYYETQHDGSAVCCYPERVHLVVRDGSGGVVTGFTGTVQLSTSTGNGTWFTAYPTLTSDDPAQGTLTDPASDDGSATYTFAAGDLGEVSLFLRNYHAGPLTITVTDGTFTNAGHNGGPLTFSPQGFVIKDSTGNDIPNQISGYPFTVTVRAVGLDPATGECDVLDYDGSHTLTGTLFYDTPASGTRSLSLAGQTVSAAGNLINLNFTGNVANVAAQYDDAGRIFFRLHDSDMGFTGDSNLFVVKPWAYAVWADGNPEATDASGPVFTEAGENFTLHVRSVCWQAADDTDNNLAVDAGADLLDNIVTVNYNNTFSTSHTLVLPSGGQPGSLNGAPNNMVSGSANATGVTFDEVGIITISADSADYLGSGAVSGTSGNIGRFTPKYLLVEAFNQLPACSGIFTYAQQPFSISATIRGVKQDGITTSNYVDGFAKLRASDIALAVSIGTGTLTATPAALNFISGSTPLSATNSRYGWGSPHDPENATLAISGADSDSVPLVADTAGTTPATSNSVNYRYGRLQVMDTYGPSDQALLVPIQAQYYSAGDYVLNTNDSCTAYVLGDFTLSNWGGNLDATDTTPVSVTTITGGIGSLLLSAPGLGNEGTVMITPSAPAWLQFDAGISTLGIYRGDDRVISWEEIQK